MSLIHLVTGGIGRGKSHRLRQIYERLGRGDGFVNRRVFSGGQTAGQDLVRLPTGESRPFTRREGFIPDGWDERCRYEHYSFSGNGIRFAEDIILEAVRNNRFPLFIDEIGPLELRGEGLAASFLRACRAGQDLYVAVRAACLPEVVNVFNLVHYEIIRVDGGGLGNGKDE